MPEEILEFVDKIYGRLGLKYDISTQCEHDDATEISVETSTALKMSKIIINKAGEDLAVELDQSVKDCIKRKTEMSELVIKLNLPSCPYAYETAKKCGFSISGIIPGGEAGDYLIMQMLPGDSMNYDDLIVVGEFEELRNDIVKIIKGQ